MLKVASTLDITARAARHRVRPDGSQAIAPRRAWAVALRRGSMLGAAGWRSCGGMVHRGRKRLSGQAKPASWTLGHRLIAWTLLATFSGFAVLGPALRSLHLAADHAVGGLAASGCSFNRACGRHPDLSAERKSRPADAATGLLQAGRHGGTSLGPMAGAANRRLGRAGLSTADCTICHYFSQRQLDTAIPVALSGAGTARALVFPCVSQTATKTVVSYWIRGPPPGGSGIIAS